MIFLEKKYFRCHLYKKTHKNNEEDFDYYFSEVFFPMIYRKKIDFFWGYNFYKK